MDYIVDIVLAPVAFPLTIRRRIAYKKTLQEFVDSLTSRDCEIFLREIGCKKHELSFTAISKYYKMICKDRKLVSRRILLPRVFKTNIAWSCVPPRHYLMNDLRVFLDYVKRVPRL